MLSVGDVRALLAAHGLAPHKSFGQNFVVDANTVRKVVRDAGVATGDLVVEVGPGLGSLTLALREAGARVIAVEIDAGLVRALHEVLDGDPLVTVIHGDALAVDYAALVAAPDGEHESALLVANLPYNVATPVLLTALRAGVFARCLVMVQREVGQRWTAGVGDPSYGAVSVKIAALAQAEVAGRVSRRAFYPVPNVDSVTVRLVRRAHPPVADVEALFGIVDAGFSQRRKRLRNTLAGAGHAADTVEAALVAVGLPAGARAEELALDDWVRLASALT